MEELVSIIMPSYNTARFIGKTIESITNQSYQNWELIIVDDCSSDNTEEVVTSFNDERIHFYKNDHNCGAAISRNLALMKAKGRWIAFLDSDDLWTADKLSKQIAFMIENDYGFTCTYSSYIDEESNDLGILDTCPRHISVMGLYLYNWISSGTVIYDKNIVGLIQIEDLKKRNDYALWLRAIKKTDCYCLTENLGAYRIRNNSVAHDDFKKLIKAHYTLYNVGEKKNAVTSVVLTGVNMVFGLIRKIFYIKHIEGYN